VRRELGRCLAVGLLVPLSFVLTTVAACESDETSTEPTIILPDRDASGDARVDVDPSTTDGGSDSSTPKTCALSNGLVGWWTFDDGTGTTAADKSPSKNNGTLIGNPTWSTDKAPTKEANLGALSFDGASMHVEIGNPAVLKITGALSLAAWIKTSAVLGNYRTIVSKWWSGAEDAAYSLFFTDPGGVGLSLNSAANIDLRASSSGIVLSDNAWHLVVGTWDGTTARIFTDGVQRGEAIGPAGFGALSDINHPVRIGTDARYAADAGDRYFPGLIDDVRIYTRALEPEEIGLLWNGTCAKP
jgi:large repetitive protein